MSRRSHGKKRRGECEAPQAEWEEYVRTNAVVLVQELTVKIGRQARRAAGEDGGQFTKRTS
jgi:hypothetical protein